MSISNDSNYFYNCFRESKLNAYITLTELGWEFCAPNAVNNGLRKEYIIHYVKNGKGTFSTCGKTVTLGVNDIFLIRPDTYFSQIADMKTPWEYYFFSFKGELANTLVKELGFTEDIFHIQMKNDKISYLISDAASKINPTTHNNISSLEILFKFLKCIEDNRVVSKNLAISRQHIELFQKIQNYISQNFTKPIGSSDIAAALNMNRSYLYRVFKKYSNTSIEDYIIFLRIRKAKVLLLDNTNTLTNIAEQVGYENYTSFNRAFKRIEGISPQEYRNLQDLSKDN